MKNNFLYRGINEKMYKSTKGRLIPKGTSELSVLIPSKHLFPSDNLFPGKSKQNAMDKHQNLNRQNEEDFKNKSAYLSTTPIYDIAKKYATNNYKETGYIFKIDCLRLNDYNVTEYLVCEFASIIYAPEDKEVLLLTNPAGEPLNSELILEIEKIIISQTKSING